LPSGGSTLSEVDEIRIVLRREAYDLKEKAAEFAAKLRPVSAEATRAVDRAHAAFFEAWTVLCMPPDDDDDEH
jgi:hypothetical protein